MTTPMFHVKHTISEDQQKQIDTYITLLKAYNETTNIYSKSAYDKLDFHIKDCINLAELSGNKDQVITDFGSGCGLPSIILAIFCPLSRIVAIESKSRKTKFLEIVKKELNLTNLEIITQNIHEWIHHTNPQSDIITSKAFAPIEKALPIAKKIAKKRSFYITPISYTQREAMTNLPSSTTFRSDPELKTGYLITKIENSEKRRHPKKDY